MSQILMKDITVGYFIILEDVSIMGFVRLNHSVLEFSDRDIVSYYRKINDFKGQKA